MKYVRNEEHIKFNQQCIQHNLHPIYTNIKIHDAHASPREPFLTKFRKDFVLRQIKQQQEELSHLRVEIINQEDDLKNACNSKVKFYAIKLWLNRICEKERHNLIVKHEKKLCNLYQGDVPHMQRLKNIVNLSSVVIESEVRDILELRLNCHLKSKPIVL
jgi:hypothetical protein